MGSPRAVTPHSDTPKRSAILLWCAQMARLATHPIRKLVGFDPELLARVRSYRSKQRISTENEAIRRLIKLGLNAERARRPRKGDRT